MIGRGVALGANVAQGGRVDGFAVEVRGVEVEGLGHRRGRLVRFATCGVARGATNEVSAGSRWNLI